MGKGTNLTQVKDWAKTFLLLDIEETKMSPFIVKHPFTDTGVIALRNPDGSIGQANLLEDKAELQKWRRHMAEQQRSECQPRRTACHVPNCRSYRLNGRR